MRAIADGLSHCLKKLNSLTKSLLEIEEDFKFLLVDLRHASSIPFKEGTRKAVSEFWAVFDPKVVALLEDLRPTKEMEEMIRGTYISSVKKEEVEGFIGEVYGKRVDGGVGVGEESVSLQQFITNSFDDSVCDILAGLKNDKQF